MPCTCPKTAKGHFKKHGCVYDEYCNRRLCPANEVLVYGTTNREGYREDKSAPKICVGCSKRNQCTESNGCQKIVAKHIWEHHIDAAEDFRHSPPGRASYGLRAKTIEHVFADADNPKDCPEKYGMRKMLYKGLDRVRNWVKLKFAADEWAMLRVI